MSNEYKPLQERYKQLNKRRTLFGFTNGQIAKILSIIIQMYVLIYLTSQIPPARFFLALELLFSFAGIIFVFSKIIQSEKEIKKFTGHYYLFPPQEIYE